MRLQHRRFPVNIARFVRTPILKNFCERLLLAVAPRDAFRALSNIYDEVFLQMGQSIQECSKYSRKLNHMVGNKKGANLKTGVTRKQSAPNFPKNEHSLPLDTHTYDCVSGGKKCSFFGKFGWLCFLVKPVLRFPLLPYYRRYICDNVFNMSLSPQYYLIFPLGTDFL